MYVVCIIHGRSLDWLFVKFLGKCNVSGILHEYSRATSVHAHIIVCAYYRASKPFRISAWFRQPSSKRDLPSSLAMEHVLGLLEVSGSACGISYNSSLILVVWQFLKFELSSSVSVDNNYVPTSKHYQLFLKQKLMQTKSIVTSIMTFMFLSANSKC